MMKESIHQPCVLLTASMIAAFIIGCGSARRGEPFTEPVTIKNDQVAQGQAIFMENCHQCHPGGAAGLGPALNDKPLPAFLIRTQVRAGLGQMPSFSEKEISDADLEALGKYTLALRRSGD